MNGIENMFSGGQVQGSKNAGNIYSNMQNQYGGLENQIQQYGNQYSNQMNPWIQQGQQGQQNYINSLNQMQNPQQFINQLMSGYQQSPQAQYQIAQGIKGANAADTASGMLGSGAEKTELQQQGQSIIGQDQQNYLNNNMGVFDKYLGGQQGLGQQGLGAQENLGGMISSLFGQQSNLMGQQANLANSQAQNQMQQSEAQQGGKNGAIGTALGLGQSGYNDATQGKGGALASFIPSIPSF